MHLIFSIRIFRSNRIGSIIVNSDNKNELRVSLSALNLIFYQEYSFQYV